MRKMICILLALWLVLSLGATAFASEFAVDEHAKISGMAYSWYQGYEPSIKNNTLTICLPIQAENCTGAIAVSIALDDPHVFLLSSEPKAVTVSPKNSIYPVKLTLSLERTRRNGDYPATITIRGTDEAGKEIAETMPYIIRIRDGSPSCETLEPVISDVAPLLDVGGAGSLTLTITNPTTTQSIRDGEIIVTDPSGDILMSGSDRLEIPEILPGRSETVTIPMTVKADAGICAHTLALDLRYQVLDRDAQWTQSFTVPVTQAIRLEQGGVLMPTAIAGELSDMTLPLMNMGRGELSNVLVKLEMDGVLAPQSVLVGTMAPGDTSQAKLTFTPKLTSVGTHSGTVTITCEDAYGNASTQTLDVLLTVDEPLPEPMPDLEPEEEKMSTGTIVLIVLCILLTAGLIAQGLILTKKIHALEEDRL